MERGFLSSCGVRAWLPHGMWDLFPRPGIELASPALEGGFLTTGPPGKSLSGFLYQRYTGLIKWVGKDSLLLSGKDYVELVLILP